MSASPLSGRATRRSMGHPSGVHGLAGAVRKGLVRFGGNPGSPRVRLGGAPAHHPPYGRSDGLAVGMSEPHGWSESGSVPPSVGVHGTFVWIGPMIPPS